jgi:hypothetical protein
MPTHVDKCFNNSSRPGFVVRATSGHDLLEVGVTEAQKHIGSIWCDQVANVIYVGGIA